MNHITNIRFIILLIAIITLWFYIVPHYSYNGKKCVYKSFGKYYNKKICDKFHSKKSPPKPAPKSQKNNIKFMKPIKKKIFKNGINITDNFILYKPSTNIKY